MIQVIPLLFFRQARFFFPIFLFCLLLSLKAFSQSSTGPMNDAQFWENINADYKINRHLVTRFSHEGRITSNMSQFSYYFEDIGLEYKTRFQHISFLADYVFIRKMTSKGNFQEYWDNRHQYYLAVTWSKKLGQFEFHDRQMIMGQVKDVKSSLSGKIPDYYLRNKFAVKYNFNYYWSIYAAEELYWHMITPQPDAYQHFNRTRYFFGGYYRPNNHHEFELYYLVEQHMNIKSPPHNFVIGLGYSYSFF